MRRAGAVWACVAAALAACASEPAGTPAEPAPAQIEPLPLDGFADAIHHWRNAHGEDYAAYAPSDVGAIADNILIHQRDHGGWIENRDPTRILSAEETAALAAEKAEPGYSFDNRNIYTQIEYLMGAFERTGAARFRDGARRGLDLVLAAQMPRCGGWPHTFPARADYHARLTIADEVMSGTLRLLRAVSEGAFPFARIDPAQRARAQAALARAETCLLDLQVRRNGALTGWAGQYDPETLAPAPGRSFEPAAIVSQETVEVVRYLMSVAAPSPEIVAAVEGAARWLEASRIEGVRLADTPLAEPVRYAYHTAYVDRRLIADPGAAPLWARFYDLADNSVVLLNRDGTRAASYADVHPERRTGYAWYGDWPALLLAEELPAWRAQLAQQQPPR